MVFILKELIRAGAYIFLLTLTLYYFVDNTLSTALTIALISQVVLFIFNFERIINGYKTSKRQ